MKKKRNKVKLDEHFNRQSAVEQGYYDGRFRKRIVPNKKRIANKRWARKDNNNDSQ